MRDYSQSGEQDVILDHAGETAGCFLDIGAGDGETFSNTRALYLQGWKGVCVEAAPWAFDKLGALYHDTDVACVNTAVTASEVGLRDFHYVRDDHLSSLKEGHAERWPVKVEQVTIMVCPLAAILGHFYMTFRFANIDTEGTTIEILRAYRRNAAWANLELLCVEAEDQSERNEIQRICDGWQTLAVTKNNMVMGR